MLVVSRRGGRRTCELERPFLAGKERREGSAAWLFAFLRARARAEAVVSCEGASPKMKNLRKAPIRRTTESWPRRKPWVKERLGGVRWGVCGGSRLTRIAGLVELAEKHLQGRGLEGEFGGVGVYKR